MGCPIANKDSMPYTKPSSEDGCKVLRIASGSHLSSKSIADGKGAQHFSLRRHNQILARKKGFRDAQYSHSRKPGVAESIPSYHKLDPGSPSESNSSSKISNIGSSSSSSPSSASSLNEMASFAVGELSPISLTCLDRKQSWYSPTRDSYKRCSTPSKTWDDSESQNRSRLPQPADVCWLGAEVLHNVAPEQVPRSSNTRRHPSFNNSKNLQFDRELVDAGIIHYNEGKIPHVPGRFLAEVCSEKRSSSLSASNSSLPSQALLKHISNVKQGSRSSMPPLYPTLRDATPSKRKCESICTHSASNSSSTAGSRGYSYSAFKECTSKHKRECKDVGYEMCEDVLLDQCYADSRMKRGEGFGACDMMKARIQLQGSALKGSPCKNSDAQALPTCAPGCGSAPYEADIGVDSLSLQLRATFCSPVKITKQPSTRQPTRATEEAPPFQIPSTMETKLDANKHSAEGVYAEISSEKYASKAPASRKKKETPPALSGTLDPNRASTTSHSSYRGMHKSAKSYLAPVLKTGVHDTLSPVWVNDGNYAEKADAFTPHAPLLPKEPRREGYQPPKNQWDWRSKSLGAKASIKSAVRNLEATFTTSRSISVPKTRSGLQKEPSSTLLERVFISPIRARSKQSGILTAIDGPCKAGNEIKDNGALQRRGFKAITSSFASGYGVPTGATISPLVPLSYNNVEAACKPFLPASKSVRCLPAPRGTVRAQRLDSGRKSIGFLSNPSNAPSSASVTYAQLYCTLRDGMPCYTMTIEGSEEVMLAKASWLESPSTRECMKWQYSFYSGHGRSKGMGAPGWRSWIKKENKPSSDLSGVMKVSMVSQGEGMVVTKGLQPFKMLEFVLYDGRNVEVSHSQSFRSCSADKPYLRSRDSSSSLLSHPYSEDIQSFSPGMAIAMQHGQNLKDLCASMVRDNTVKSASDMHKGTGCHRPSLSLDALSDSEVPDSVQSSTPYSSLQVELAAMVIQLSAEGDSHVFDGNHVCRRSIGWGLKFLNAFSESELLRTSSPRVAQAEKLKTSESTALDHQPWFGSIQPYADSKLVSSGSYICAGGGLNSRANHVNLTENRAIACFGRQRLSGSVTLLLPSGEHSFPVNGSKGPSSLIERWRAGGSCECGGWDLGCGVNVLSTDCPKGSNIPYREMNGSAAYDQQLSLFSQGSRPELMLGLSTVKEGEFKLSFEKQLCPLKVFATAVAILHSHQLSFMDMSRALASSSSSLSGKLLPPRPTSSNASLSFQSSTPSSLVLSPPLISPAPIDTHIMMSSFKKRLPHPL